MGVARARRPAGAGRRLAGVAAARRTRRGQDARRRRMGARPGAGPASLCHRAGGAHRARRRDVRRRARGDGRGNLGLAVRAPEPRTAGVAADAAAALVVQRGAGAGVLGRGPGEFARTAVWRGLGRRARQMETRRGDVGQPAIWPPPRRPAAPGGDHDATDDAIAAPADRRQGHGGESRQDPRQRGEPRAGVSRRRGEALRGHAPRPPGTGRRDDRGSRRRALAARHDRAIARGAAARASTHRRGGGPAGIAAKRHLRDRRRRHRQGGDGLRHRRRDARRSAADRMGGASRGALPASWRPTRWWRR